MVFTVKIERNEDVSILKDMIKEKAALSFAAKDLILLNVSLPLDNLDSKLNSLNHETCRTLSPSTTKVSLFFPAPPDDCLHILVKHGSKLRITPVRYSGSIAW